MSFKKDVKNELNTIWSKIYTIKDAIKINNEEISKDINKNYEEINKLDKHSEKKWTEHQKRLNEHYKKIEMLINSENEVRLAIKTIAEILAKKGIIKTINKGEQKNEWSKSKSNNSKQSIPKHSKQRVIQK